MNGYTQHSDILMNVFSNCYFFLQMWTGVSGEAKDLVHQLLQRDPEARPSAQECLHHPWLSAPHKKQNGMHTLKPPSNK